jgi:NAD(P)-dependent dehydrogenase (short-subunit alcohol dehydrogenase family)
MQKSHPKKPIFKAQSQEHPGLEFKMDPLPVTADFLPGSNKLLRKRCIITGGDSGIGRAVAIAFAKEGADVAIIYLPAEEKDAQETARLIREHYNSDCILCPTDLSTEANCTKAIKSIARKFKQQVDVLVNNAAVHYPTDNILNINSRQLTYTFTVNIFAMFWIVKAALPFMQSGGCIINSSSVTAYRGSGGLLDYSATKGAIVSFTRSLSANLLPQGIRVNGVAPGPVWTPLVPASFEASEVAKYGTDAPMQRPAQPIEVAPSYVFLASADASYISGQFIHVNGGEVVNG